MKQRAHQRARKTRNPNDWAYYKALQTEVQKETRIAHRNYVQEVVSNYFNEKPKRFWSYVKSKRQESSGVSSLVDKDGFLHSNSKQKAEILNDQFHSVYTTEDHNNFPEKGRSQYPTMDKIKVHCNGVLKLLKNLKVHKATGPDDIPAYILKAATHELAPILTHLYQSSLDRSEVPTDWKEALIVPLFKKGEKHKASNYRSVSLTSIACKIIEHIIHSSVINFLEDQKILKDNQHGFRARRSCETQLISTIHDIANKLRTGRDQVDLIQLDFAKTFDKVPHRRLLHKLHYYGIRNETHRWIESILQSRKQQVVHMLENCRSNQADVLSGVPQRTILGPILFLVFINDLPEVVKHSSVQLFADDCILFKHIESSGNAMKLQQELTSLEESDQQWQMKFHPEKCTVMRLGTNSRMKRDTNYSARTHPRSRVIEQVPWSQYQRRPNMERPHRKDSQQSK